MSSKQENLFEDKIDDTSDINKSNIRFFIPINRLNLYTILASGVIAPPISYFNYEQDLQTIVNNKLVLVKNGFDFTEINKITDNRGYSALIEIDVEKLDYKNCYALERKKFKKVKSVNDQHLFFYTSSISNMFITCIHFESENNLEDFKVRGFENVPLDSNQYQVSPDLFSHQTDALNLNELKNITNNNNSLTQEDYQYSDSVVGAFITCMNFISPKLDSFYLFKRSIDEFMKDKIFPILTSKKTSQLDIGLFEVTMKKLIQTDLSLGWVPKEILNSISQELDIDKYTKDDISQFQTWKKITEEILDNKRNIPSLLDEKFIVGRAILLTLLRPSPDDLKKTISSSLEPGPDVLSISSFFVGALFGFETLSNEYKSYNKYSYYFGSELKSLILNKEEKKYKSSDLCIDEQPYGSFGTKINLTYKSLNLIEKDYEGPVELNKILLLAKSSKDRITLDPDRALSRLKYTYEFKDGRRQTVYIKVGQPTKNGGKTLRFYSPCLDISIKSNLKSLKKLAMTILERSNDPERYCRFAIDHEIQQLVVMRDQIDFTGSATELEFLKHVAEVADEFEKTLGLDKF
jgi:hypothetical protein